MMDSGRGTWRARGLDDECIIVSFLLIFLVFSKAFIVALRRKEPCAWP